MALDIQLRIQNEPIPIGRVTALDVAMTMDAEMDRLDATIAAVGAPVPPSGRGVEAWVGGAYLGAYAVASVDLALPEDAIQLTATGADLRGTGLRTPATRAWADGLTLAGLAEQIAASHGYEAVIHSSFRGLTLPHLDQITESDLQFLSRVADRYDADIRYAGPALLMLPRYAVETAGSLPLHVELATWTNLNIQIRDRSHWSAATARYFDFDAGAPVTVRYGAAEGAAWEVLGVQGDAATARAAAQRAYSRLLERSWTLTATVPGDPNLIPHCRLTIPSLEPRAVPVEWRVIEATHRVRKKTGWLTSVRAGLPTAGDAARPDPPPEESKRSYSRARSMDPDAAYRRLVERPEGDLERTAKILAARDPEAAARRAVDNQAALRRALETRNRVAAAATGE